MALDISVYSQGNTLARRGTQGVACVCAQAAFAGKGNKALDNGVASTAGAFDNILMNGQEVFKFAVRAVPTARAPSQHL